MSALYFRGLAYTGKSQHDHAIEDFSTAIRLKSDYAAAFFGRGFVYGEKSQYDRAIEDYTEAIRIRPEYSEAFNNRGQFFLLAGG